MLRRWDPEPSSRMIERDRAQSVFLVPTHAQMIRNLTEDAGLAATTCRASTPSTSTPPRCPTPLKEWVLDAFPGVGIHELYGSTEGGIITNLRPADARRKAGSVGHPWFMTEVRVVDDEGSPVRARRARRAVQPVAVPHERLPRRRRGHGRLHHRRRLPHAAATS